MSHRRSSSGFTDSPAGTPVGPPMIGALMRLPWEAVLQRLLRALHENGFDDIEAPQLGVLLRAGPGGVRPARPPPRQGGSKEAPNFPPGRPEQRGFRQPPPSRAGPPVARIALTDRGRALIPVIRG